jgi:hypothetical protein
VEKRNPFIAWFLGWLIPGAGHLYVGRRAQGLVLLGSLGGCYLAGLLLGRGEALSAERMEFLVVQAGAGVPAALGWWLSGPAPVDLDLATRETGVLYTVAAALLNLVAALAAAAIAAGRDDPFVPPTAAAPEPAPEPTEDAP